MESTRDSPSSFVLAALVVAGRVEDLVGAAGEAERRTADPTVAETDAAA
jgi:hypothetical protein